MDETQQDGVAAPEGDEMEAAVALVRHGPSAVELSRDDLRTLKDTVGRDANLNDSELRLFGEVCKRTRLDPFARQIHVMRTGGKLSFQTSIDGYRLIAERTGKYDGQDAPEWLHPDGSWRPVWIEKHPPVAARVSVYKKGISRPFVGVITWAEYTGGKPSFKQQSSPAHMLAKTAEALALRKAFPNDLSAINTVDEMEGARRAPAVEVVPLAADGTPQVRVEDEPVEGEVPKTLQDLLDELVEIGDEDGERFRAWWQQAERLGNGDAKRAKEAFREHCDVLGIKPGWATKGEIRRVEPAPDPEAA